MVDSKNNTGNWNSGNGNSGNWNSGYGNSGNRNSGNGNSGNWNSGWFNTDEPNARFFNKESNIKLSEFYQGDACPHWKEFYLTKWVDLSSMTDDEKKKFPTYEATGGYLKKFSYKEAFCNFWRDTSEENRKKFLNLPGFNADMFFEITGIDVREKSCAEKIVEIDGKKFKLVEVL